ncbi:MAG: hypothetical protein M1835_003819, partial [Candelina submexicana]
MSCRYPYSIIFGKINQDSFLQANENFPTQIPPHIPRSLTNLPISSLSSTPPNQALHTQFTSCTQANLPTPNPSACISSIIRITFVPRLLSSHDGTYAIAPAQYWSVIETNIGILAASIPSFKAVANRWLPRLLNTGSYNEARGSHLGSGPWGRPVYGKGSKGEGSGSKDSDGLEDGLWGNNGFGKLEGKTVADAEMLGLPIQGPRGGLLPLVRNGTAKRGQVGDEEYLPKPLRPRIGTVIESRYPCVSGGGGGVNNDGGGAGEGRGSAETASEELMVVPEGEIVKQTQIMRHVSGE